MGQTDGRETVDTDLAPQTMRATSVLYHFVSMNDDATEAARAVVVDPHLLPASRPEANPPAAIADVNRWYRQMD